MLAQQKLMYKQQAAMSKEFDEMRERRKASIAKEMQQYQQRLKNGWRLRWLDLEESGSLKLAQFID